MATKSELITTMIFQLNALKTSNITATENTKHNAVLSSSDGYGITSKKLYEMSVKFAIERAGIGKKPWPTNWMDLSVKSLADAIY